MQLIEMIVWIKSGYFEAQPADRQQSQGLKTLTG